MPPPDPDLTVESADLPVVDVTALDVVPVTGDSADEVTVTVTSHGERSSPSVTDTPADETRREAPTVPVGTVFDGRYRLDAQVGAGGGGIVYRATDLETDEQVAVKLLRPDRVADERARMRFRREFRAIARLEHPNCLAVRTEGRAGPYPYMVMDFVDGGDLGQLSGARVSRLLPVLVKLAHALDYVHGQRIVHRDLKPGNVLLTADEPPEPKLADFGVAAMQSEMGDLTLSSRDGKAAPGTVDYMSPEQVRGDPADPRSDLYAFGCMMFRLLAGRPPFEGNSYNRLVGRLLQPAPDLQTVCDVEPELAAIVARLLERDADARYQSALDLARDLAELDPEAAGMLRLPADMRGAAYLFDPGLVGRDAERGRIAEWLAAVGAGEAAAGLMAIVAPAGTGKTRLTHAALRAHPGEAVTVRVEAAGEVPFAPLPALEAAFAATVVEQTPGTARPAAEPWTAGLRDRVARLAESMVASPVSLVFVDDLHLAEPGAMVLLGELLDRLAASPRRPALLATARPVGVAALDRLAERVPLARLELAPLDDSALDRLVAGMLGLPPERLPAELAAFVRRTSQGNPLLIGADMQMLAESGALSRIRGGWVFDPPGRDSDLLATEVLRGRLDRLAEPTRRVLAHAALCGDRFDTALVGEAFEVVEGVLLDAIDDALRAQVIRPADGDDGALDRYAFVHARLTEVLYDQAEPVLRARGHRRIAEVLATRPATPASVLAHHFTRSDDRAAGCRAAMRAGEAAQAVYAFGPAERFFEQAIERIDALPERLRSAMRQGLDERLADVRLALGRVPEALSLLEALTQAPGQAPLDRARRLRKLGMARLRSPDTDAGVGALEQALTVLGDRRPRTRPGVIFDLVRDAVAAVSMWWWPRKADDPHLRERAICHRELGFMYRWIDMERGGAHLAALIRLAVKLDDPELLVDGLSHAAMGFTFLGVPGPVRWLEEAARRMAVSGRDRVGEARVEVLSGVIDTMVSGDERAARQHFDRAMLLADEVGDRFLTDFVCTAKGWCLGLLGRFGEALADFDRALASATALGADWLRHDASAGVMMVQGAAGGRDDMLARARLLAGPEVAMPMPALGALGTEALGAVAFQEGRFRAAIGFYVRARKQYVEHHLERGWGYLIEIEHIEALLCLVDTEGPDAVPDLLRQLRRSARQAIFKLGRMKPYAGTAELLRGVVAARSGRAARARRLFDKALSRRSGPPTYMDTWLRVRSTIERLHLGDPPAQIARELDTIAELYDALGAHAMIGWLGLMRRHLGV